MFEFKLIDIFSTLCVGFITVMLGFYIYFLTLKLFKDNKYNNELFSLWSRDLLKTSFKDTWYAFLAIVVIYFFGIVASDLTGRMTDSDDRKTQVLHYLNTWTVMEQEGKLRKEALFNIHTDSSITGLGTAIFLNKHIVNEGNNTAGTHYFSDEPANKKSLVAGWGAVKEEMKINDTAFTSFVFQIYYTAKNWVYSKEHEPLQELKDIQSRIDLSRSIVLIVASSLIIILSMAICFFVFYWYRRLNNSPVPFYFAWKGIGLLFILLLTCRECYHINEINYLKRAFGYYVSHIQKQEEKVNKQLVDNKENGSPCY